MNTVEIKKERITLTMHPDIKIMSYIIKDIQETRLTTLKKADFHEKLNHFDVALSEFLQQNNYTHPEFPLFETPAEQRLAEMQRKVEQSETNPAVAITDAIKVQMESLSRFLQRYHFGFLQKAEINERGMIEVVIPCTITSGFSLNGAYSRQQIFNAQMAFLKEEGFVLKNRKLINCEQNFNKLRSLLSSRGGKAIKFSTWDDEILEVSFIVKLQDVENFDETPFEFVEPVSETLNRNEESSLLKSTNEIIFALEAISTMEDANVPMSIVEGYFAELCETLEFDGIIRKQREAQYITERKQNQEIQNLSQQIGSVMDADTACETIFQIRNNLSERTAKTMGFYVQDFLIDKYGNVSATLNFAANGRFLDVVVLDEDNLKKIYSACGSCENETLAIQNTESNYNTIEKLLSSIVAARINSLDVVRKNNLMCIQKVHISISDIKNLLNA